MFDLNVPKMKIPKIKNPSLRRALPRKRDLARATNIFNKPIREPVPAKVRKSVLAKAKNKCQYSGCSIKEGGDVKLQIHHKDFINDNNKLSNLMVFCATHHGVIHKRNKVVHNKDLTGRRISSKVVKKKTAEKIKRQRKQNPFGFNLNLNGIPD